MKEDVPLITLGTPTQPPFPGLQAVSFVSNRGFKAPCMMYVKGEVHRHTEKAEECKRRASFFLKLVSSHPCCIAKSWDQRVLNSVTPSAVVQCEGVAVKLGFLTVERTTAAPHRAPNHWPSSTSTYCGCIGINCLTMAQVRRQRPVSLHHGA